MSFAKMSVGAVVVEEEHQDRNVQEPETCIGGGGCGMGRDIDIECPRAIESSTGVPANDRSAIVAVGISVLVVECPTVGSLPSESVPTAIGWLWG